MLVVVCWLLDAFVFCLFGVSCWLLVVVWRLLVCCMVLIERFGYVTLVCVLLFALSVRCCRLFHFFEWIVVCCLCVRCSALLCRFFLLLLLFAFVV